MIRNGIREIGDEVVGQNNVGLTISLADHEIRDAPLGPRSRLVEYLKSSGLEALH